MIEITRHIDRKERYVLLWIVYLQRQVLTSYGGDVPELIKFQEHFKEYRIVVFGGLNCEDLVFDGQAESEN
jgi:hypothetical protein